MRTASFLMTAFFATMISPAMAQVDSEPLPEEEAEETVDPIRRYTVELIIFAYAESASTGGEIWIADEPAIEAAYESSNDNYFGDFAEDLTEIETSVAHRYMDLELVLSGEDDYTMNGIYDKLVRLDAYEPLVRTGWTQPTYEKEVTASIELQTLAESPPWLDGSLTLYLGRYLHLEVFGRHATDSCLRRVGQAIRRCLRRASDVAARVSDDKLVVLSHASEEAGVMDFAGQIATAVRELGLHHPRSSVSGFVTVSFKVCLMRAGEDADSVEEFLAKVMND